MKRKRPTKQQRLETRDLINQLQDDDEDTEDQRNTSDAIKAVELDNEQAKKKIKRECKTLDPKRRIMLEQRLEFQDTLYSDRVARIKQEAKDHLEAMLKKRQERSEKQDIDEKIEEYTDVSQYEWKDAPWKTIGKFKCVSKRLSNIESKMTSLQKERYGKVLAEMARNGWRVTKKE